MSLTPDERDVLERLEAWAAKMRELMDFIGDRPRLPRTDEERAREMYRAIKDPLCAEYRKGDTGRGGAAQTEAERRWYQRTIHQACVHLYAPINTTPGPKWFSSLYEARADLTHTIFEMKARDKETP